MKWTHQHTAQKLDSEFGTHIYEHMNLAVCASSQNWRVSVIDREVGVVQSVADSKTGDAVRFERNPIIGPVARLYRARLGKGYAARNRDVCRYGVINHYGGGSVLIILGHSVRVGSR